MKVLVTGGAGYIGSITVRELADRGHECIVLDTLEKGWREAIDPRARLVEGSVGDRETLDAVVPGCDAVMHLAGLIEVGESQRDPERYFRANAIEPLALLDSMVGAGVGPIVFSSTAAVYGEPEELPITEEHPTVPVNAYGASKLAFERSLDQYAEKGVRSLRFRYFNVAGAWPDGSSGEAHDPETHLIPRVLASMRSGGHHFEVFGGDYPTPDGTCVRDYIHVCDLANAHVLALEHLAAGGDGGVFNLGNGEGFSNLEVVRACAEVTGTKVDVTIGSRREGDPAVLVASACRAKDALGWEPRRSDLHEIIADAHRWHLAHPDGYR
jgi:UDP-glucose 4-epimerase